MQVLPDLSAAMLKQHILEHNKLQDPHGQSVMSGLMPGRERMLDIREITEIMQAGIPHFTQGFALDVRTAWGTCVSVRIR
jgi:hypothetical protein